MLVPVDSLQPVSAKLALEESQQARMIALKDPKKIIFLKEF
jgi:hypothetical protein